MVGKFKTPGICLVEGEASRNGMLASTTWNQAGASQKRCLNLHHCLNILYIDFLFLFLHNFEGLGKITA